MNWLVLSASPVIILKLAPLWIISTTISLAFGFRLLWKIARPLNVNWISNVDSWYLSISDYSNSSVISVYADAITLFPLLSYDFRTFNISLLISSVNKHLSIIISGAPFIKY